MEPPAPVDRLRTGVVAPFARFFRTEASSGVLLLGSALVALLWANSPFMHSYTALWELHLGVMVGGLELNKSLVEWINEGLMAIFFFVVGLEIKREVLMGELASPRRAALPVAAALGGMVVPASLYALVNAGGPGRAGWGIPMATDIAFALGILALFGHRMPTALKVFLTSLAIVDDLGAVLVIALFYTAELHWGALLVVLLCFLGLLLLNRLGVRRPLDYGLLGLALWGALLVSGVHATIAGVLVALAIPARGDIDSAEFHARAQTLVNDFGHAGYSATRMATNEQQQAVLGALEEAAEAFQLPSQRLEHALHPWVVYAIMPLFALANAGVALTGGLPAGPGGRIALGVAVGLVVGKPLGILLGAWLATRLRLGALAPDLTWRLLGGVACLGGIGFTMSLFIADLAFGTNGALASAKLGILAGSLLSGTVGWLLLRRSFVG